MSSINQLTSSSGLLVHHSPSSVNPSISRCANAQETLMTNSCSFFTAIDIPEEKVEDFAGVESFEYFYAGRYLGYSEELGHNEDIYSDQHQTLELSSVKESDILCALSQLDEKTCAEKLKAFICSNKGTLAIAGIVAIAGLSYLVLRLTNEENIEVAKRNVPKPSATTDNITPISPKTTTPKTIENLDYDSLLLAINECEPSNNNTNLEALIRFNNETCVDEVLKEVFCPSSNSTLSDTARTSSCTHNNPIWQSANTENPSVMLKVSCDEFKTLLGASVTKADCIESMRFERLKMPSIQTNIKNSLANSALKKLKAELQLPEKKGEICVSLDVAGIDIANIGGGQGIQIRPVECKPKFNAGSQATQAVTVEGISIEDVLENACVKKVALISDGISNSSNVKTTYKFNGDFSAIAQNSSAANIQQTCPSAADKLVTSLLRRCPSLDIIDIKATTDIQNNEQCASVLSGNNLVQSLDALSKDGLNLTNSTSNQNGFNSANNSTKPDTVIIFEPHEVGGYTGDVPLTQEMVTKLENQGVSVYSYESSQGSWLRSVPNIKQTSSVTEMVAKPISIPESIARQSGDNTAVATSSSLTTLGIAGLGLGGLYCLYKNKKRASTQQPKEVGTAEEAIPLETIAEDDECEDCEVTRTINPDGSVSTRQVYLIPGTQDTLDITRTVSKTGTIRQNLTQRFESTGRTHNIQTEHTSRGVYNFKEFGYRDGKDQVCSSTSSRYQAQPLKRDEHQASTAAERSPFLTSPKKEV